MITELSDKTLDQENNLSINVEKLTKKFGDFTAVDGISFSIKRGETFAFIGPNGAGKTTTIKMLTTLLSPTSGIMFVNSYDPIKNQDVVRRSFGIVFQRMRALMRNSQLTRTWNFMESSIKCRRSFFRKESKSFSSSLNCGTEEMIL